ncbi:MAG: DUF1697 domain-containing protein [Acidobacteriota bacterium]|nr:DUF1697 domain-containing protein [Acidobacteriota bacterium]
MTENTHVALLRGINVGSKNRLLMSDLSAMFAEVGCADVRTYIQSGNVVFRADPELARLVPDVIGAAIAKRFGYRVPVLPRTSGELAAIVRENPFLRDGADTGKLHVGFLAKQPEAAAVDSLDRDRSPPDEFAVLGREVYFHCPLGLARTKFTAPYFESKLSTIMTVRNWRTVLRLREMTAGLGVAGD